jgi:hypothetical protein
MGENEALQLRVLEPLNDFHERILRGYGEPRRLPDPVLEDYLPKFRHLPPLRTGDCCLIRRVIGRDRSCGGIWCVFF